MTPDDTRAETPKGHYVSTNRTSGYVLVRLIPFPPCVECQDTT